MQYMKIGKSDLNASVITLGAWAIGGGSWWANTSDDASVAAVHTALDNGINMIDTASIYGLGHSEEVIGKALATVNRQDVLISTKGTFSWRGVGVPSYKLDGVQVYKDMSYGAIIQDCEDSLKRLGTDYIDLYYIHNPSPDPEKMPHEDTVRALMELKKEGKIRAIGLSNVQPAHIELFVGQLGCEADIIQRKYSMLDRTVEAEILPLCDKYGMSLHAYSPLERGLLTGKISKDYVVPAGDARDGQPWWKPEKMPHAIDFVAGLEDICKKNNCTYLDLAVAFVRGWGSNVNVICGSRKPEHTLAAAKAGDVVLSAEDLAEIRNRIEELEKNH